MLWTATQEHASYIRTIKPSIGDTESILLLSPPCCYPHSAAIPSWLVLPAFIDGAFLVLFPTSMYCMLKVRNAVSYTYFWVFSNVVINLFYGIIYLLYIHCMLGVMTLWSTPCQ